MRPLASAAGATAILRRHGSDEPESDSRVRVRVLQRARAYGFYVAAQHLCTKPMCMRARIYKTALGRAPHKASVQDLVQLVERREELGRHLLVRPVGRVDALELLLLVGALRVEQQVQEKHNQ